jgi:hypothetical protein
MRSMRPGRSSASSSACGRFVAIIVRMRYFGGGFGRMPSRRRTCRLIQPLGFFRPDISVSSAWSVPMPPPPMPAMMIPSRQRRGGSPAEAASARKTERMTASRAGSDNQRRCSMPDVASAMPLGKAPPPGRLPRLPSESASSKNTMTPP